MNLTDEEKKHLPHFQDLNLNGEGMNAYIATLYSQATNENSIGIATVNWLKVGVAANNKSLINAIFNGVGIFTEKDIEDAIEYAVTNKSEINPKIMDTLAENIVSNQYQKKHMVQSPHSDITIENSAYKKLNGLEYLTERIKDVFNKRIDVEKKIMDIRTQLNNDSTKSTVKSSME